MSADESWAELLGVWQQVDAPKNCKVEIIDGIITVAPPVPLWHHMIADTVHRPLYGVVPEDWGVYQRQAVTTPARRGLFVPDLLVVGKTSVRGCDYWLPADDAELVVEITSDATAHHDRFAKPPGYAVAGVPLYLLIDSVAPGGSTVTLYGEPKGDVYRVLRAVPFGKEIHIPAPFDLTLDTGEFPVS
ncbi:Uma2 family endonuclease [Streptomyces sp. NPDC048629]|uniref:Uma2 family endonuclease n=1 Tax=Streptomyces sp. NPDC048629 TaxID=3154824 RepID=UPI00341AA890